MAITSRESVRVMIIDQEPVFRLGMKNVLEGTEFQFALEAESAQQALECLAKRESDNLPSLILLDPHLRDSSGFNLIKELRGKYKPVRIIACSHAYHTSDLYVEHLLKAGCRGVIEKHESSEYFLHGLRRVQKGMFITPVDIAERMIIYAIDKSGLSEHQLLVKELSSREYEVFRLIGEGKKGREIANYLNISIKTSETYIQQIKKKLRLKDMKSLIRVAIVYEAELKERHSA